MKLGEIIKSNSWLSVELTLLKIYPDQENIVETYQKIYADLQEMESLISAIEIIIKQEFYEETQELGMAEVYGMDNSPTKEYSGALALGMTPWNKWLGMRISELTQKEFTELEIIAHCLYEMTYYGYEEEEIQSELSRIEGIVEEYKNLTPEEKKLRTTSLEDLLKDLDKDE
jgi:hypothetical protein